MFYSAGVKVVAHLQRDDRNECSTLVGSCKRDAALQCRRLQSENQANCVDLDCSLLVMTTRISVGGYELFGEICYIHLGVVICYLRIQGSSAKKAMQCPAKESQSLSCHNCKNVKSASFVFHRERLNVRILQF